MKRFIALIATLMMIVSALPAFAAGTIAATEETWYVVSHSDDYRVYYYATVVNNGAKRAKINDLLFEIQEDDGTTLESTAKYKLYPEILEPGQSGWLVISKDVKDIPGKSVIDHYTLTITSKVEDDRQAIPLTASAQYLKKDEDDNEDVLRATVTNDGAGNAFDITMAVAARDVSGKLLYVASDASKDIGLSAGSSLMLRSLMKTEIVDALVDDHVDVASAEAIAYTVEDIDD